MYAGFLYRLNYEDYQKRESELDEKIKRLTQESDKEDITPVDEAYIIRIGGKKMPEEGHFLLLVGDHHYDAEYIEDVLYEQEGTYARHKELQKKDTTAMTWEEMEEGCSLWEKFAPDAEGDLTEIAEAIVEGKTDWGEVIKQIF